MTGHSNAHNALGWIFLLTAASLFVPADWHPFIAGVVILIIVLGFVSVPSEHTARRHAIELYGEDSRDWPAWSCGCGQRNAGWLLACGICETPRDVEHERVEA